MRSGVCWGCGGSGGDVRLHEGVVTVDDCTWCSGTGLVLFQDLEFSAADDYCEEHGHQPDCPHDPTDWDARMDDIRLDLEGRF